MVSNRFFLVLFVADPVAAVKVELFAENGALSLDAVQ